MTAQLIPIVRSTEDPITKLIALFDEALASRRRMQALGVPSVHHWLSITPDEWTEYAARLWASANQLGIRESTHPHGEDEEIRVVLVLLDGKELIRIQYNPEPIAVPELNVWSPATGGPL